MYLRIYILILVSLAFSSLYAQGIQDSLFRIRGVEIVPERIFLKEEAGMKQTVVDSLVLRKKVNLSLSDVLSENTSVFIKNNGRGALATASFRGTAASHTRVTWNGIDISSPMAGMVDFSLIPVYIIDDLILKHGASSIADQGGGIGGSINIANSAEWAEKRMVKYLQGVGSYRTFDEQLMMGFGNDKVKVKTRLYHNYSRNDYRFLNRSKGYLDPVSGTIVNPLDTNENAQFFRYGILQEFYYRPSSSHILSFKYWGQYADRTIPRSTSYEGPDQSNLNNQKDTDHRLVADWKFYLDKGRFSVRSGYTNKQLVYSLKNRVPGLGLIPAIYSESRQQSFINELSYQHEIDQDLSLEGSMDMNMHQVESEDSVSKAGYEKNRSDLSLFMAVRKNFSDRLNVNLMVRQEWVDGSRAPLIPYLGLDIRPVMGTDLVIKGNIARNYHQPSLNDLYWQPGGNPDLLPEQGFSVESGLEYQVMLKQQLLKADITLFRSDIENWIIWIPGTKGYWEALNINRVLSKGLEFSAQLNGKAGVIRYRISGTYAYTSSVNYGDRGIWGVVSYGKQLVYIPLHSGNFLAGLSYRGYSITYQHNSYSERFTTSSNDPTRRDWLYPYFMNDFSAGKDFSVRKLNFSIELKIHNLFNESYHSVLYRPMPGRNYHMVLLLDI